jgi:hypothetical protein
MTTFKTTDEITAAGEFIQYLEKLRSSSPLGTNRAFERLSNNAQALLQEALSARFPGRLMGEMSLSGVTLSWASDLTIYLTDPVDGTTVTNVIPAGSLGMTLGFVIYVTVDRTTDGASVSLSSASPASYTALLASSENRLDLLPVGYSLVAGGAPALALMSGHYLRSGYAITNGGFTDTQYAQQTTADTLQSVQRENLNARLIGGGDVSWNEGTEKLTWSAELRVTFPRSAGYNRIPASNVSIPADSAWYATLSRTPAGVVDISTGVALLGAVPDTDNTMVLAIHNGADDRVYLYDGSALSDGETIKLGGARSGVQWYYRGAGTGVQVLNLDSLVAGGAEYRVGTGELMVYRNGVKAIGSQAYWSGVYGVSGSLSGSIDDADDYLEEDLGDGRGERIIWLGDDTGDAVEHAAGTHDPPLTYPDATDTIEAFVGVQGQAPTVNVPGGIYGFDRVWASSSQIDTNGGYLVSDGEQFSAVGGTGLSLTTADMVAGEILTPDSWHYVYLAPAASTALPPLLLLSTSAPTLAAGGPGVHPTNTDHRFLTSVYVTAGGDFVPFEKHGTHVRLRDALDLVSAFSGVSLTGAYETVDVSSVLPATSGLSVDLQVVMTAQAAVSAGNALEIRLRPTGGAVPSRTFWQVKPGNTNVMRYPVPTMVSEALSLDFLAAIGDFQSLDAVHLVGYSEGRHTSGDF